MHKSFAFLLCLTMILTLASCDLIQDQKPLSQTENTSTQNYDADIAMQMYQAAINDEIPVFDEYLCEAKLKSLRFISNGTRLDACKLLKKAILDLDLDGVNEYVIQSTNHEHIILRYHYGRVYSYRLDSNDFYRFNTDGTFYWYDSSDAEGWKCGLNKIVFEGETLIEKSLYSLQYSENSVKYEYFVEGEAVTVLEYDEYRNHNIHKESMTFSQFELTCSYPITAEQAWILANAYWDHQDGCAECSAGTVVTARIVLIDTPNSDTDDYRFAFQWEFSSNGAREGYECMPPHSIREHDQILVNAFTGEIVASTYDPDSKGVCVEEAIEIAKNDCEYIDFDDEENGYRAVHDPDAAAPDHIYVIVIQKYDTDYSHVWIDKNTGKSISRYYLYGK